MVPESGWTSEVLWNSRRWHTVVCVRGCPGCLDDQWVFARPRHLAKGWDLHRSSRMEVTVIPDLDLGFKVL